LQPINVQTAIIGLKEVHQTLQQISNAIFQQTTTVSLKIVGTFLFRSALGLFMAVAEL
jgi:hypothetical protein